MPPGHHGIRLTLPSRTAVSPKSARSRRGRAQFIDAHGCIVAPGSINPHTHYDAQICWDPAVTPSSWHGVTSVVMGNCGVGIAPCRPEAARSRCATSSTSRRFPSTCCERASPGTGRPFPNFMDAAERRGSALNLGFLAPLTPFRHYVMGEASMERAATRGGDGADRALLREAIDAGAFGFSTTVLNQHLGFRGRPLACRNASRDELKAYCNVLKERGKGAIEIALTRPDRRAGEEEVRAARPPARGERPARHLSRAVRARRHPGGGAPIRCARPALITRGARAADLAAAADARDQHAQPLLLRRLSDLEPRVRDKSKRRRRPSTRDPAFRNQFREELKTADAFGNWARIKVHEVTRRR